MAAKRGTFSHDQLSGASQAVLEAIRKPAPKLPEGSNQLLRHENPEGHRSDGEEIADENFSRSRLLGDLELGREHCAEGGGRAGRGDDGTLRERSTQMEKQRQTKGQCGHEEVLQGNHDDRGEIDLKFQKRQQNPQSKERGPSCRSADQLERVGNQRWKSEPHEHEDQAEDGRAPLSLQAGRFPLRALDLTLPVASAQIKILITLVSTEMMVVVR